MGGPQTVPPRSWGNGGRKALGERCPTSGSRPQKDSRPGARIAAAVLGAEAAPLLAPRGASSESLPMGRPQLPHSWQGGKGIATSLRLGRGHKGPRVHQESVHV